MYRTIIDQLEELTHTFKSIKNPHDIFNVEVKYAANSLSALSKELNAYCEIDDAPIVTIRGQKFTYFKGGDGTIYWYKISQGKIERVSYNPVEV